MSVYQRRDGGGYAGEQRRNSVGTNLGFIAILVFLVVRIRASASAMPFHNRALDEAPMGAIADSQLVSRSLRRTGAYINWPVVAARLKPVP